MGCCRLPTLAPRLPFLPALPALPQPPVFVPGRGFMGLPEFVETAAPPLTRAEEIYLQSLTELARSLTGKLLPPQLLLTLLMWLLKRRLVHLAIEMICSRYHSPSSLMCLEHARGCSKPM